MTLGTSLFLCIYTIGLLQIKRKTTYFPPFYYLFRISLHSVILDNMKESSICNVNKTIFNYATLCDFLYLVMNNCKVIEK